MIDRELHTFAHFYPLLCKLKWIPCGGGPKRMFFRSFEQRKIAAPSQKESHLPLPPLNATKTSAPPPETHNNTKTLCIHKNNFFVFKRSGELCAGVVWTFLLIWLEWLHQLILKDRSAETFLVVNQEDHFCVFFFFLVFCVFAFRFRGISGESLRSTHVRPMALLFGPGKRLNDCLSVGRQLFVVRQKSLEEDPCV